MIYGLGEWQWHELRPLGKGRFLDLKKKKPPGGLGGFLNGWGRGWVSAS
jgi:hypothetical protein